MDDTISIVINAIPTPSCSNNILNVGPEPILEIIGLTCGRDIQELR